MISPQMRAGFGGHELHVDAQRGAGLAHTTFHRVAHAQFVADAFDVDGLPLVGEGSVACRHHKTRLPSKRGGQVLGDAVGDGVLLLCAVEVVEW